MPLLLVWLQVSTADAQALCVCPTRELVTQNLSVLLKMGRFTGITAISTAGSNITLSR